uniref:Putative serine carboxypeptidase n=1 Tax=Amblyomma tuberculatum TaxID=48802 RepID=A0A6M2E6H5_9ACAR
MKTASLCACLLLVGTLQPCSASHHLTSGPADPNPLFLTPWIRNHSYDEARNKSKVELFKLYNVTANAYSGYITVNKTTGSNLFFLFVEAEENATEAPLMLWTQGGPGLSALFGLFLQNGPVQFDYARNFSKRELTIQKHVSVIYLDAPVGAGFSFTKNESGYPTRLQDVTRDISGFLRQFLELFLNTRGETSTLPETLTLPATLLLSPARC